MKDLNHIEESAWIHQMQVMLDKLNSLLRWNDCPGRKGDSSGYLVRLSNTVYHKILTGKLLKYRLDEQTGRWTKNWLNGQAQRVMISGMKSSWKPVTGIVPQGSILGLILFTTFIRWWCRMYAQPVRRWHKTESRGQRAMLPSQGILTGWRNRPTGTPQSWIRNAKSAICSSSPVCSWRRTTPCTRTSEATQLRKQLSENDLKGVYEGDRVRVFSDMPIDRTRGKGHKLKHRWCCLIIRKHFCTMKMTEHWHRLPGEVLESPSLDTGS